MHIFRKLLYTVKSVDTLKFSLRHFSVNFVQFYLNLIKEMVYLTQLIYSAFFFKSWVTISFLYDLTPPPSGTTGTIIIKKEDGKVPSKPQKTFYLHINTRHTYEFNKLA